MTAPLDYRAALGEVYGRATRTDRAAGRMWYPIARGQLWDLAKEDRVSLKRTAYAAAALSNNMEWGANVELLRHVLHATTHGQAPHGHYAPCLAKASAILLRGEWDALRGPKVRPFAQALYGDRNAAVIDRHMARAAGLYLGLTARRHVEIGAALRQLARDVRRPVADVQATIWIVQRRNDDPSQAYLSL